MAHLNRARRYPAGSGRRSTEANGHFAPDCLGHVLAHNVKHSSSLPAFDEAGTLAMMKRSDPALRQAAEDFGVSGAFVDREGKSQVLLLA
ncbi:hypothetical protein OGR47_15285 [Methylocystis sp. MJC1]|jgi:hypothetical protein|uniref:hypothetical protein n=1 Tax=Methylocystis sp. MJC1 TaxID=2654282 RepID=UPI0013EE334F|nr:hypothetical protein [Methylocystis sp. MJC1]KAF2989910.1 hypothetical protein MJC1_03048 [Methylocystis sp. MJC1]MBU6528322.1 hypothetical protein [Methylocystis sp. MJC1]UZX11227.1 hypothetical protein OGR47_15285 [Methylocystis sp. MJC1]